MIGCLKVVERDKKLMSDIPTFEAIIPYNIQMNSNSGFIGVEIFVISSTKVQLSVRNETVKFN